LQEGEREVHIVRENLQIVHSRQKSYTDHRRRELSFEVGNYVYLKVLPMRRLRCFKVRGKLTPRFIGPFKITKEREEEFKAEFLNFFSDSFESQGQDSF
jgi:threonine dehydratase